jgi:hypothetical protein
MDPWHDINLSNRRYSEEELQEIQERYLVKPAEAKGDSCTGEGWLSLEVGAGGPDQSDRPKEVAPQGDRERVSCGNRGKPGRKARYEKCGEPPWRKPAKVRVSGKGTDLK